MLGLLERLNRKKLLTEMPDSFGLAIAKSESFIGCPKQLLTLFAHEHDRKVVHNMTKAKLPGKQESHGLSNATTDPYGKKTFWKSVYQNCVSVCFWEQSGILPYLEQFIIGE